MNKKDILKNIKIAAVFVSAGLLVALAVFFIFFGKGLQFILPLMLFAILFVIFIILEKSRLTADHPIMKAILAVIFVAVFMLII